MSPDSDLARLNDEKHCHIWQILRNDEGQLTRSYLDQAAVQGEKESIVRSGRDFWSA